MIKVFKITLFVVVTSIFCSGYSFASGDEFSGIIIYNVTYPETGIDAEFLAIMPKTMKMMVKGEKSRTEISLSMGTTTVIFDGEKKSGATLMQVMGQKFALTITEEDIQKEIEEGPDIDVEITGEIKEIAGYKCQKAIVRVADEGSSDKTEIIVFFTDELGTGMLNYNNPFYKDISGVMLEYAVIEEEIEMKFSAISVEKKKISDDEFIIPKDYQVLSQSEMENMMGIDN